MFNYYDDFEQIKNVDYYADFWASSHFTDFEQVKNIDYYADFEQVKKCLLLSWLSASSHFTDSNKYCIIIIITYCLLL